MLLCHSEERSDEESRKHPVIMLRYVLEILPPFGRLNDNYYKMTRRKVIYHEVKSSPPSSSSASLSALE